MMNIFIYHIRKHLRRYERIKEQKKCKPEMRAVNVNHSHVRMDKETRAIKLNMLQVIIALEDGEDCQIINQLRSIER